MHMQFILRYELAAINECQVITAHLLVEVYLNTKYIRVGSQVKGMLFLSFQYYANAICILGEYS